jgi:hypothetical protein
MTRAERWFIENPLLIDAYIKNKVKGFIFAVWEIGKNLKFSILNVDKLLSSLRIAK